MSIEALGMELKSEKSERGIFTRVFQLVRPTATVGSPQKHWRKLRER